MFSQRKLVSCDYSFQKEKKSKYVSLNCIIFIITGREFPKDFQQTVRTIFKQCFRVFAHIYYQHYEQVLHLREEKHFNSLFAHFISFAKEFNLLPDKKELAPLEELIAHMENNGRIS